MGRAMLVALMLQVPKMLGTLRSSWAPEAFVVSFKLETDTAILVQKVRLGIGKREMATGYMLH